MYKLAQSVYQSFWLAQSVYQGFWLAQSVYQGFWLKFLCFIVLLYDSYRVFRFDFVLFACNKLASLLDFLGRLWVGCLRRIKRDVSSPREVWMLCPARVISVWIRVSLLRSESSTRFFYISWNMHRLTVNKCLYLLFWQ